MGARKQMGAEGILSNRATGGEVLAVISGARSPNVETARAPRKKRPKAAAPAPRPAGRLEPVLYRVTLEQRRALNFEAFKRAQERGSGKPDASEVLREALDAWMEER